MKTINIDLPDGLEIELSLLNRNQHNLILDAIREKIKKQEDLRKELEEGYKNTSIEDLNLTKDFESADLENWK